MSEEKPVAESVKMDDNGKPFTSEKSAYTYRHENKMNTDIFGVVKYRGGWVIAKHSDIVRLMEERAEAEKAPAPTAKITYKRVSFHGKPTENDLNYVPLSVNGQPLRINRGVEVILPSNFLEVAEHAVEQQFEPVADPQIGQKPFVVNGEIHRYPFTILGDATEEEYLKGLAAGNAITNAELEMLKRKRVA